MLQGHLCHNRAPKTLHTHLIFRLTYTIESDMINILGILSVLCLSMWVLYLDKSLRYVGKVLELYIVLYTNLQN